jgi:hypothetical protein
VSSNLSSSRQEYRPTSDQGEDEGIHVLNLDHPRETTEKGEKMKYYER